MRSGRSESTAGATDAISARSATPPAVGDDLEAVTTAGELRSRYQIREDENGRYLTCSEAPNVAVRLERGRSVTASGVQRAAANTIFLDGVAQTAPFIDAQHGIFNLDHHEGCVRAFTLAACEQAMVMVLKGLDLGGAHWKVIANEPDLDTVLAIWLLLNHRRVHGPDATIRQRMMPIVRLQGVIDAHGFELAELTGFDAQHQAEALAEITELRREELALKRAGEWDAADPLELTRRTLEQLDGLVYEPGEFDSVTEVEELARTSVGPAQIAIACRSQAGIYEVERQLRSVHGRRVGVVALERGPRAFTIRQIDPFLPTDLNQVCERLNQLDPRASNGDRWGGSADIGGSPRRRGTGLTRNQVLEGIGWAFKPPSLGVRLGAVTAAVTGGLVAAWLAVVAAVAALPGLVPPWLATADVAVWRYWALTAGAIGLVVTALGARRHRGRFGVRWPRGALWPLAAAVLAPLAALGGVMVPAGAGLDAAGVGEVALVAAAVELLLRGGLHGPLVRHFAIMRDAGPWFVSWPSAAAALVQAVVVTSLAGPPAWLGQGPAAWSATAAAGFVAGLILGAVRERTGSLLAAIVVHAAAAAATLALVTTLG